ncbi:MAG: DNA mismatch repair endonuclease MutL [Thermoanaerobaculia bacterium]
MVVPFPEEKSGLSMMESSIAGTSRIHVLGGDLVNQIAAGEVVERPASVVKELVENAIDAGAGMVDVELENGGKRLIQISDDGCGMSSADAALALERHATSKIARFEDLLSVGTLGFRGEALPSIASVSRFRLVTWDGLEPHGVEIDCDTGRPESRPAARDRGTTITVRELFENVPARRKFLKSVDSEYRAIISVVTSYALPAPDRAFRVTHNGRVVLDLPAAVTASERVAQILGRDAVEHLVPIDTTIDGCRASGFVTRGLRYGSRRNQFFFVNGRLVKDRVLMHAVTRAVSAFDADGHPAVVLFLSLDPDQVDVNVHPAKTEVRFRNSGLVHVVIEQSVKRALGGAEEGKRLLQRPEAGASFPEREIIHDRNGNAISPAGLFPPTLSAEIRTSATPPLELTPLFRRGPVVQPPREEAPVDLGDLQGKVIGQYRFSYILIDMPGGLRLVDQHVAHERVLYDRIAARMKEAIDSQTLLTPFLYETGAAEAGILDSHLEELRAIGFEIERFSGNSFAVSSIPVILGRETVASFIRKLIDASMDERLSHVAHIRERVIASLACQAAIKVHRPLGGTEMSKLVEELLASSNPYACPHGRPIIVDIRHPDIEKHFHRV